MEGQARVIQAETVQQGRLQIVHVDLVLGDVHAEVVRLADHRAALDAAARQEEAVRQRMMVAAGVVGVARVADLAHRGAAEFAAPDYQRVLQQSALLQVLDQRRGRLVGHIAMRLELAIEIGVVVPTGVVQHHEAHAAFHHAARQQAVGGELFRGVLIHAVHGERLGTLLGEIEQLGRRHLHAEAEFVGRDARGDLHVAGLRVVLFVEILQHVEAGALHLARDARRVRQIQHRVARTAEHHALIRRRKIAARPVGTAAAGADAGTEHHESRQILRFAAEAVEHPRAHGRAAHLYAAAEEQQLPGMVIECVGDTSIAPGTDRRRRNRCSGCSRRTRCRSARAA